MASLVSTLCCWGLPEPERSDAVGERCDCLDPNVTLLINPHWFVGDGVLLIGGKDGPNLAAIREHRKGQMGGHQASFVKQSIKGDEIHGNGGWPIGEGGRDVRDLGTGLAIV